MNVQQHTMREIESLLKYESLTFDGLILSLGVRNRYLRDIIGIMLRNKTIRFDKGERKFFIERKDETLQQEEDITLANLEPEIWLPGPLKTMEDTDIIKLAHKLETGCEHNTRTGCDEWKGATTDTGYGVIDVKGRTVPVSRLAFILFKDDLPADGMKWVLRRKCKQPRCCNPNHLELLSRNKSASLPRSKKPKL